MFRGAANESRRALPGLMADDRGRASEHFWCSQSRTGCRPAETLARGRIHQNHQIHWHGMDKTRISFTRWASVVALKVPLLLSRTLGHRKLQITKNTLRNHKIG